MTSTSTRTDDKTAAAKWRAVAPLLIELLRPRWQRVVLALILVAIGRAASIVLPASTKYLVDEVLLGRQPEVLPTIVLAVLLATVVHATTVYALSRVLSIESARLVAEMRETVQAHVSRLPLGYYDLKNPGGLASRVIADVDGVKHLLGTSLVEFVGSLATAVYSLAFLLHLNVVLTTITLLFMSVYLAFTRIRLRRLRPVVRQSLAAREALMGRFSESAAGIRVVKGYGAEEQEARAFGAGNAQLLAASLRAIRTSSLIGFASAVVMGTLSVCLMYVGATQILNGNVSMGSFLTFTAFVPYLTGPMAQLSGIGMMLTEALVGLERTQELLRGTPEHRNPRRTEPIGRIVGAVSFNAVTFGYEPGKPVLTRVSFQAAPGTVTALVGPSGSGKSTIANLVAAFYEPEEGVVLVDGCDLSRACLESYRRQLGVVLQDTFLFSGTIRENVAFARPNASDADILLACRAAHVDDFVRALPRTYDTVVGDRGVKLSAGQRQRISIARALLADPRILILDEATSSLDSESEAAVEAGLRRLMGNRTTFVIAHRLSTVRDADQILVLDDGCIVERGTHDELYRLRRRYYSFYERQHPEALLVLSRAPSPTMRSRAISAECSAIHVKEELMT